MFVWQMYAYRLRLLTYLLDYPLRLLPIWYAPHSHRRVCRRLHNAGEYIHKF